MKRLICWLVEAWYFFRVMIMRRRTAGLCAVSAGRFRIKEVDDGRPAV